VERNGNQCTGIKSSGSVLQAAMMSEYTKVFTTECEVAPAVEYKATSSSQALKEWGSEKGELNGKESGNGTTVDKFIASDLPPEKGQIEHMDVAGKEKEANNSLVTVPVAQSAVAVLVSLPAACPAGTLEKPHVEDLGLEEEWFAKKGTLEELIKSGGIAGCATKEAPKLFVRKDSSSATAGFKRFMNEVVKANWSKYASPLKVAASNEWPAEVDKTSEGGEAEAKAVYATPNSMGYADLADAKAAGFTSMPSQHKNRTSQYYSFYVEVQNKESEAKYASPEILESEVTASNCKAATYTEPEEGVAPNADWSKSGESNSLGGNAYPICTLTYDLAWQHYAFLESEIFLQEQYADTVQSYIQWLLKTGQEEKTLKSDHLAPLPTGLDEKAKTAASNDIGL
jgi:ABC-type phosphate transport system substrate-binding protein